MNPQVAALVWIHCIAAFVRGLPALIGSFYTGWGLIEILRNPLPALREVQSSQDGMLQLITGAERGVGMVLRPLAAFGEFFTKAAFAVSIVVLLLAIILFSPAVVSTPAPGGPAAFPAPPSAAWCSSALLVA